MNRLIAAVFCSVLLASSVASAQDASREGAIRDTSRHTRPQGISAMLYVPWLYGPGIGINARYEIPVVPDGFIPAINDQFSIEPSLGLGYRSDWGTDWDFFNITPAAYATWSFHITPKFRPYVAVGLGVDIGIWLNDDDFPGADPNSAWFFIDTAAGLFYNFSPSLAFRGEIGSGGPKAGLSFFF